MNIDEFSLTVRIPFKIFWSAISGARKYVILDFGFPILLTDLIIPACPEIASLCIDVWLFGESVDGQRLLVSNDFDRKTVAATNLRTNMLCRFLKVENFITDIELFNHEFS